MLNKKHYFLTATEFYNPMHQEFMGRLIDISKTMAWGMPAPMSAMSILDDVKHSMRPVCIPMVHLARDWSNYER